MKRVFGLILLSLFMVVACATQPEINDRPPNPRIVYRDLTKPMPVRYKVPQVPDILDLEEDPARISVGQPNTEPPGFMPQVFIEFRNESFQLYDVDALKGFIDTGNKESHIFLVGHSHGKSSVGTLRLASQRATVIKAALEKRGFKNVYVMASWGAKGIGFAPSRGVHLYVVGEIEKHEGIPLILARIKEGKINAAFKEFMATASIAAKSLGSGL